MLSYLSKFVLQMLPTISATVIGAYIVSTWINPKAPPEPTKIASKAQLAPKVAAAAEPPAQEAAAQPAETKPLETKPAEDAKPVKAAKVPDSIRIIPIVKQPAAMEASVSASTAEAAPAVDERKDANELARAAIQRLRGSTETARTAEEATKPVAPAPSGRQQARVAVEPPPVLAVVPALPPAVSISAPRYPQSEAADHQSVQTQPERVTPPGEIPTPRSPLNLQASHRVAENPSLADDFLSATKSFFRAITPQ